MTRNTEQWFAEVPEISVPRSKFEMPQKHMTTFNDGMIIPAGIWEVVPGDTCHMKMASVIRMSTPLYPTMDNAYMDVAFFFVPTRLLWTHWKEFWGENTNAWYQSYEYAVPHIKTDIDNNLVFENKSLADYMGIPCGKGDFTVSALPFRGYVKIYNDWWRSEVVEQEVPNWESDADAFLDPDEPAKGGNVLNANKFFDMFTSALKAPQKGPTIKLPLGTWAPVQTKTDLIGPSFLTGGALLVGPVTGNEFAYGNHDLRIAADGLGQNKIISITNTETAGTGQSIAPMNLWTNLTQATAASLADLRQAIALQHFYERQAYGSRYIEFIKNIFGVTSPDARLQRSEFLGSKRIPINIFQATQQSATTETSPLGQTGAFSHTADADEYFTKSFTEHGYIYCLVCVRTEKSYSQGLDRMFSRRKFTDYYIPTFNGIGDQAILNKEIFVTGDDTDEEVFGYAERYAEYRYGNPNKITGAFKPDYSPSLDAWHYGEDYEECPTLGAEWLKEDKSVVDRTLAVSSEVEDQFLADFFFNPTWVRPMPVHSVPGLARI